jgi:hypothetical protein
MEEHKVNIAIMTMISTRIMCARMWFDYFGALLECQTPCMIHGRECDNKEGGLNWEHPLHRVLGYKRRSDVEEGDIIEVRVCS